MKSGLSSLSVFSLKDRLICSVQSRQVGLFCLFPNHLPLGFITPSVLPRAQTGHSAPLLLCVLAQFRLSRRFGQALSSLARSLCMLRKAAKWHPGGNQKHALASLSLLLEMIWDYVQFLALCRLQANTQACMKARREIKEWVLCFVWASVLITEAQKALTGLLTHSSHSVEVQHRFKWNKKMDCLIKITAGLF